MLDVEMHTPTFTKERDRVRYSCSCGASGKATRAYASETPHQLLVKARSNHRSHAKTAHRQ